MSAEYPSLTEREKETLRLLLAGHEAKSIARELDLSVHTVNDRLRNARAKLGVNSSREAARRLAEIEGDPQFSGAPEFSAHTPQAAPESLAHNAFGVESANGEQAQEDQSTTGRKKGHPLMWLSGGMIIMSLIIAAIALLSITGPTGAPAGNAAQSAPVQMQAAAETEGASAVAARGWLALVDSSQWEQSWETAGTMFKSQLTAAQWTETVQPVRQPLGALVSRQLASTNLTDSLPGVPKGEYAVLQFRTDFTDMKDTVETVTLVKEASGWAVVGYFIKPA